MSFGKFETTIVPSQLGETFPIDTHVVFKIHEHLQTGVITKQLKNSAVVELDETLENQELVVQSNGIVIVNYKHLKKI